MSKIFIIAEAGVNHNGKIARAGKLIDAATEAGADAVKFQTFKAQSMISKYASKADYQKKTTDENQSQLEMVRKLELGEAEHKTLIDHCRKKGIMFLSTPFDLESLELLMKLGLEIIKVPSGEITNLPLLRKTGSLNKKVIMSTGMAELREIEDALNILTEAGTAKKNITVLQCNTQYPTPFEDANLLAMLTIKNAFGVHVGYSDHTLGIEAPIAAAALGATVIEKHFTLDKNMRGPDHSASLEPDELKAMVDSIRNIEKALGNGQKEPTQSEIGNKAIVRKSIVAKIDIKQGTAFATENITAKRPGTGISPMNWDEVIGKIAKKDFSEDELIEL